MADIRGSTELVIKLRFTNESQFPLWISQSKVREAVTVAVFGNAPVPPGAFVAWTVTLKRHDNATFTAGDYRLAVRLENTRAALRTTDGAVWRGRVGEDGTREFVVRVELPASVHEQAVAHQLQAAAKVARTDFLGALDDYSRAAEADPADLSSILGMAQMYRILGRYREALPLFAKLLEQRPHDSRMAFWLALAHAGVGEERKAIEVLRTAGIAENDIPERMQEIRSYIGSPR